MKKSVILWLLVTGVVLFLLNIPVGYSNVKADGEKSAAENIIKETDPLNKKNVSEDNVVDSDNSKSKESEEQKDSKKSETDDQKSQEKEEQESTKEQEKSDFDLMVEENMAKANNDDGDEDGDDGPGADQGKGRYVKPSPRPLKSLGMIIRSGFFVQPSKHYYVKTGKSVIIKSKYKESIWNRLSGLLILADPIPNYRWRYSEDMEHWLRFKKKVCKSKNYEFKAKKTGDYYLQSRASAGLLLSLGRLYYYSEIANVHVVDEPKDAINLKVRTDEDYLYNLKSLDNVTTAHDIVAPEDASGTVRWSGDNKSLATIDPISGEIEANTEGRDGEYTITCTFTNNDGTKVTANKAISIGGGLDDQTVGVGEDAVFKLEGVEEEEMPKDWHVEWYEVFKKGKDKKLKTGDKDLTYTIKNASHSDNQRHFYVQVFASGDEDTKKREHSFKTRTAVLNVVNPQDPLITFDVEVENLTYKEENHKHNTDKVMKNDRIKITSVMDNKNILSVLKYGVFELPLQNDMGEKDITVALDGNTLKKKKYRVINDDGCPHLRVENLEFIANGNGKNLIHKIEVEFNAREPDETMVFDTRPRIHGNTNFDSNDYSDNAHNYLEHSKHSLTMNYTRDELTIEPSDISFGNVSSLNSGEILKRTNFNDKSNSVVVISDHRRKPSSHDLSVSQKTEFKCDITGEKLPVSLRYYNDDGGFTTLSSDELYIPKDDIDVNDASGTDRIFWEKDSGLLMHVNDEDVSGVGVGTYHAKLEWSAKDTI